MISISIGHIKALHQMVIDETGGEGGIRDEGLLSSAVSAAFASFDGRYFYPTIEDKAARLGYGIIQNHPFIDGNKRIGLLVMLTFLELNNIYLSYTDNELVDVGHTLASKSDAGHRYLHDWINSHKTE